LTSDQWRARQVAPGQMPWEKPSALAPALGRKFEEQNKIKILIVEAAHWVFQAHYIYYIVTAIFGTLTLA